MWLRMEWTDPTEERGGTSVFEKGSSNGACLTVEPQQQLDTTTTITDVEDAGADGRRRLVVHKSSILRWSTKTQNGNKRRAFVMTCVFPSNHVF